jgi:hypothetical protein
MQSEACEAIVFFRNLYLGRLQIAFFSVSNEHQEQGAKTRNSRLLVFMASEKPQFVAFRGIKSILKFHTPPPLYATKALKGKGLNKFLK